MASPLKCNYYDDTVQYHVLPFKIRLIIFIILIIVRFAASSPLYTASIAPNFTASYFSNIDISGAFLTAPNSAFTASILNPDRSQASSYYLVVTHTASNAVVWTANRGSPVSNSALVKLTPAGLSIVSDSGSTVWSTPPVKAAVSALRLRENGNLVLVDSSNVSLWQSFDYPTDTIVVGQKLAVGKALVAAKNGDGAVSGGDYGLTVTSSDAVLTWHGMTYWKLSMDLNAFRDLSLPVSYLGVNGSGLYLFADSGSGSAAAAVVIYVSLPVRTAGFRIAKLGYDGKFTVSTYLGNNWVTDFSTPADGCDIPFVCGTMGLCSAGGGCGCPPGFSSRNGACVPVDSSLALSTGCHSTTADTYSYVALGPGMDYFSIGFIKPVKNGVNLSDCESICSANCSCLGVFYGNSSGSCYLIDNYLGSVMSSPSVSNVLGYIKAIVVSTMDSKGTKQNGGKSFPIFGLVLLPSSGVFLVLIAFICWRRRRRSTWDKRKMSIRHGIYMDEEEFEDFSIPGLPVRFDFQELVDATGNFGTQIGSGGFGIVYKGTLKDNSVVAVKKITSLGVQGKKEFCTEIAIIGNVHHVNLVKLKGFCAQGRDRYLVYEYMNRGSLDQSLFGKGPVLEWQERVDIALGTARGLAYLHSGCDRKIIHCDVKPENILLHDNMQVKISDFGLSKLLTPEQSGLFTTMRGTRGYLAPEWLTSSAISDKTDVYSYGMVLLELVRGRKNCVTQVSSHSLEHGSGSTGSGPLSSSFESRNRQRPVYFPLYALEMHEEGRYLELVDFRLEGRAKREEVEKLVRVALCCVHEEPTLRPTMVTVVGMLEGVLPLGHPRMESLNFLRFYGRRFTEASTVEGGGETERNELYRRIDIAIDSSTSASPHSVSYMSSHQVSGPR